MTSNALIPILMLFTLGAGLLIAIVLLMRFLRKSSNRHPMDGQPERNIQEIRSDGGNIQLRSASSDTVPNNNHNTLILGNTCSFLTISSLSAHTIASARSGERPGPS